MSALERAAQQSPEGSTGFSLLTDGLQASIPSSVMPHRVMPMETTATFPRIMPITNTTITTFPIKAILKPSLSCLLGLLPSPVEALPLPYKEVGGLEGVWRPVSAYWQHSLRSREWLMMRVGLEHYAVFVRLGVLDIIFRVFLILVGTWLIEKAFEFTGRLANYKQTNLGLFSKSRPASVTRRN